MKERSRTIQIEMPFACSALEMRPCESRAITNSTLFCILFVVAVAVVVDDGLGLLGDGDYRVFTLSLHSVVLYRNGLVALVCELVKTSPSTLASSSAFMSFAEPSAVDSKICARNDDVRRKGISHFNFIVESRALFFVCHRISRRCLCTAQSRIRNV